MVHHILVQRLEVCYRATPILPFCNWIRTMKLSPPARFQQLGKYVHMNQPYVKKVPFSLWKISRRIRMRLWHSDLSLDGWNHERMAGEDLTSSGARTTIEVPICRRGCSRTPEKLHSIISRQHRHMQRGNKKSNSLQFFGTQYLSCSSKRCRRLYGYYTATDGYVVNPSKELACSNARSDCGTVPLRHRWPIGYWLVAE